jgi:HEAT repeat protein
MQEMRDVSLRVPLSIVVAIGLCAWPSGSARADRPASKWERRLAEALANWNCGDNPSRLQALSKLRRLGYRSAPAVELLIPALSHPDTEIRSQTAAVIGQIGLAAERANTKLIALLKDPSRDVRAAAAQALTRTGPDPKEVIPPLLASLRTDPDGVAEPAITILASCGESSMEVALDLSRSDDPRLAAVGLQAITRVGPLSAPPITELIASLRRPPPELRELAATALGQIGKPAIGRLLQALRDPDPNVRGGAARALELMGKQAAAAVPALIGALADREPVDDPIPTSNVGNEDGGEPADRDPKGYHAALVAIGPAAFAPLLRELDCADHARRERALRAIACFRQQGRAAVPRLIGLLSHPEIRLEAAAALGRIGGPARAAIPMLTAALKNRDPAYRLQAVNSLGLIGRNWSGNRPGEQTFPASAVGALAGAVDDIDPRLRIEAVRTIGRIGPHAAHVSLRLAPLLRGSDNKMRLLALRVFPAMGRKARLPLTEIVACLEDADCRLRLAAAEAIRDQDLQSEIVLNGLLCTLHDPVADVRAKAAFKLALTNAKNGICTSESEFYQVDVGGEMLATSPRAGEVLRKALADPDASVRAAVAYLLPVFKEQARESIPPLIDRLKDTSPVVRVAAAAALGQFGPAAHGALPALLSALEDTGKTQVSGFTVSTKAALAIQQIGTEDHGAVCNRLLGLLDDRRQEVRETAAATLTAVKSSVGPRLFETLADAKASKAMRSQLLAILAGESPELPGDNGAPLRAGPECRAAIPVLRQMAEDADQETRIRALGLLGHLEPARQSRAKLLLDIVRQVEGIPPNLAPDLGEPAPLEIDDLIKGLHDPDEDVRAVAAAALAQFADDLPRRDDVAAEKQDVPAEDRKALGDQADLRNHIVDALLPLLDDPDTQARCAALWALGVFGPGDKQQVAKIVPKLIEIARDRSSRLPPESWVAEALPQSRQGMDADAEETGRGAPIRLVAFETLGLYGEKAAGGVSVLIDALKGDEPSVREAAAEALGAIGPGARAAVPLLIELLQTESEPMRGRPRKAGMRNWADAAESLKVAAASALSRIGRDARAAVPLLISAAEQGSQPVQLAAIEALATIGSEDPKAVESLGKAMCDQFDESLASRAATALAAMGNAAVPVVARLMEERDPDIRFRAARMLAGVGPAAAAAVPSLERAAGDPDPDVRNAVDDALKKIRDPLLRAEGESGSEHPE